jgi:outer membrane protein assembly factor BamB
MSQLPDRRDLGFAGAAVFAVWFLSGVIMPLAATAGDWPQILGPDRRGQALDDRLPEKFPAATLKPVWELPVGKGFSGVAIQGDVGVVFDRQGRSERALGFHPKTGEKLWEQKFASNYQPQFIDDDGPRCTPTIADDQVILFGAGGGLHVLDLATGAMQWTKETAKEFAVSDSYFGAGSTPLVVGDVVVVNVRGSRAGGARRLRSADRCRPLEVWQRRRQLFGTRACPGLKSAARAGDHATASGAA